MNAKLYQRLASLQDAVRNCIDSGNAEWGAKHAEAIDWLCANRLPSGSGFDAGITLDRTATKPDRLVFVAPFHRMDDAGYYREWIKYRVTVTPSLAFGFTLRVSGPDRAGLRGYVTGCIDCALRADSTDEDIQGAYGR